MKFIVEVSMLETNEDRFERNQRGRVGNICRRSGELKWTGFTGLEYGLVALIFDEARVI